MRKSLSVFKLFATLSIVAVCFVFNSCRTSMPIGEHGGQANVGYLLFTSKKMYVNKPVEVNINNGETVFTAKLIKFAKSKSNGTSYQISTGKKSIVVSNKGEILYKGTIMLYPQETKVINLK